MCIEVYCSCVPNGARTNRPWGERVSYQKKQARMLLDYEADRHEAVEEAAVEARARERMVAEARADREHAAANGVPSPQPGPRRPHLSRLLQPPSKRRRRTEAERVEGGLDALSLLSRTV